MRIIAQIPNILTLSNLVCGSLAIYAISQGETVTAAYLILLAALADFLDGFAARLLKVSGPMGAELDSLADVVSFGLAPAFIAISMLGGIGNNLDFSWDTAFRFSPLVMAAFSAYRLAKFNIDTRQSEQFIGMPTPANALLWLSFPLIGAAEADNSWISYVYTAFFDSPTAIFVLMLACSFLLVSEIPMISLKFKNLKLSENLFRIVLLVASGILIAVFMMRAILIILILYVVLSIIQTYTTSKNGIQS